ncbi:MarR family winged helix-turn-helix transcriptional regulator [Reichenbachiella sp.]
MDNIEDIILFQIDRTSKVAKLYSQKEFEKQNVPITTEQWIILKIIQEHKDISQKELADLSLRDPASITRTLDLLEKKSLIARKVTPNNRRQYRLGLTSNGESYIKEHLPRVTAQRKKSIAGLTELEQSQLLTMLRKIQKNLE